MAVVTLRYIWRIAAVIRHGPPETEIEALTSDNDTGGGAA